MFIFKEDTILNKIRWMIIMLIFALIMLISYLYHKQYLIVENEKFVLKNSFGKIKELNINECYYDIMTFPSYFSWVSVIDEKWICIYLKDKETIKFKIGFSNSRKQDRIQLICNQENLEFIKKHIGN